MSKNEEVGFASALRAGVEDFRCMDAEPHPPHVAGIGDCPGFAHRDCAEAAAYAVLSAPRELGDEGWEALEARAVAAGWDREMIRLRRRREDFTRATIEAAYQYGLQRAARAARELGSTEPTDVSTAVGTGGGQPNASDLQTDTTRVDRLPEE